MHREPTPPSTIEGLDLDLPPGLEELILRCLMKAPKDRFQTMEEVGDELRYILRSMEGFIPDGFDPSARRSRVPDVSDQTLTPVESEPSKSHTLIYSLVALLTALLSGGIAWLTRPAPAITPLPEPEVSATSVSESLPKIPSAASLEKEKEVVPSVQVRVVVLPLGARIFEGNDDLGIAPVTVAVGDSPRNLKARRAGYLTQSFVVTGETPELSIHLTSTSNKDAAVPSSTSTPPAPSTSKTKKGAKGNYGGDDLPAPW
jgi:hypothetical protein